MQARYAGKVPVHRITEHFQNCVHDLPRMSAVVCRLLTVAGNSSISPRKMNSQIKDIPLVPRPLLINIERKSITWKKKRQRRMEETNLSSIGK